MSHASRIFTVTAILAAACSVGPLATPARAQGALQTITQMKVDPATLATGYRTTKVVGSQVQNEANEVVGTIDDLIVTPSGTVPYAVISVGGFLGMGTHYVVVPANTLSVVDKHMLLRGATKDLVKTLPPFNYTY